MKKILIVGAGKSATHLIEYLLTQATNNNWQVLVADARLDLALLKLAGHPAGQARQLDVGNDTERQQMIAEADIVVSMLPPTLHGKLAVDCAALGRHLLTASYVDDQLRSLRPQLEEKGLLFLCEMGLDPGIDHMSAMEMLDEITREGGQLKSFRSHCGGLVAPESDTNPWHYKISWNPRNIVLAGKAGAHFRRHGQEQRLTHEQLFGEERLVHIPGLGPLAWYPNRDSLCYEPLYGLEHTPEFVRTTLRHPHFMKGWHVLISLGLVDERSTGHSIRGDWEQGLRQYLRAQGKEAELERRLSASIDETGWHFATQWQQLCAAANTLPIDEGLTAPVDWIQQAVEKAWALAPGDRDMIVMLHELEYERQGQRWRKEACLVVKGDDDIHTAMSKTVGLPLGIACKLIMEGRITQVGLRIPVTADIYQPVLDELKEFQIEFIHHTHIVANNNS